MGKARQELWKKNQRASLIEIYRMVLRFGWTIELDRMTPEGTYIFKLAGENPTKREWDEDWQFGELDHFQSRRVTLTWDPKHDPYTDDTGEWVVR